MNETVFKKAVSDFKEARSKVSGKKLDMEAEFMTTFEMTDINHLGPEFIPDRDRLARRLIDYLNAMKHLELLLKRIEEHADRELRKLEEQNNADSEER